MPSTRVTSQELGESFVKIWVRETYFSPITHARHRREQTASLKS